MTMIAVNDVELHVREHWTGPTVVLVRGFPHTGAMWAPVAEQLALDHRVVVPERTRCVAAA